MKLRLRRRTEEAPPAVVERAQYRPIATWPFDTDHERRTLAHIAPGRDTVEALFAALAADRSTVDPSGEDWPTDRADVEAVLASLVDRGFVTWARAGGWWEGAVWGWAVTDEGRAALAGGIPEDGAQALTSSS